MYFVLRSLAFKPHAGSLVCQVLSNLISNGCKFTPEGGRVLVAMQTLEIFGGNDVTNFEVSIMVLYSSIERETEPTTCRAPLLFSSFPLLSLACFSFLFFFLFPS